MKNSKIWLIIKMIIAVITLVLSVYCIKVINDLDMLPTKICTLIIVGYSVLNLINVLFLIPKKMLLNILGIILSIVMIVASFLGIKHGTKITNYLNSAFNNDGIEVTAYNIAVLKSSDYNNIQDLEGKVVAYTIMDENQEDYVNTINSKLTADLKLYEVPTQIYDELLNKNVDAIIVTEGLLQVLDEEYEDVDDRIKIIYNFEIEQKVEPDSTEEDVMLKSINILVSGSDSRTDKIVDKSRSDVNMIITINPKTHKVLLTSIPRDYYVQVHGKKGNKDKLAHSGIWGTKVTRQTIEDLFGIKIDYTVKVGFQSVIKIVDLVGGVDIYSEIAFTTNGGDGGSVHTKIEKGYNHLNGAQALSFARERYAYRNGDHHRIQNQQQVLEAVANKISSDKSLLLKYDEMLDALKGTYKTDIPLDLIKLVAKEQIENMPSWKIEKQQVTGGGYMRETLTAPGKLRSVIIPNMDSVKKATKKINNIKDEE